CSVSVTGSPTRCYAKRAGRVNGLETPRDHPRVHLGRGAQGVIGRSHPCIRAARAVNMVRSPVASFKIESPLWEAPVMLNPTADLLYPIFQDALEMLTLTHAAFINHDPAGLDSAELLGRSIHKRETELTEGLPWAPPETAPLRFIPSHVERIGDALEGVIRSLREMEAEGTPFTD